MKETLLQYGYTYLRSCHCDGFYTEKFINGDYQCAVRVKKNIFKIKKGGHSVTQWIPVSRLEETLKTYSTNVAIQA